MRFSPSRLTMLAGWLFADLFLVLVLVGLSAMPASPAPRAVPSPSATPTPTRPPTPQPSPTHQPGLDPTYLEFTIDLSPQAFRNGSEEALLSRVNAELDRRDPTHRRVGFVLVFASDDIGHVGRAVATATDVVNLLHARSAVFGSSAGLGYWTNDNDSFEFKVFFLN